MLVSIAQQVSCISKTHKSLYEEYTFSYFIACEIQLNIIGIL